MLGHACCIASFDNNSKVSTGRMMFALCVYLVKEFPSHCYFAKFLILKKKHEELLNFIHFASITDIKWF